MESLATKAQNVSGIAFSSFLGLHIVNHLAIHAGFEFADNIRSALRFYYQNPVVELTCVFGAAAVHVAAGVTRIGIRKAREWRIKAEKAGSDDPKKGAISAPPELKAHRWAGYALALFFVGHVAAVRVVPMLYFLDLKTNHLTVALWDAPWFFYIYYPILGFSGLYHMMYGLHRALGYFGVKLFPSGWQPGSENFKRLSYVGAVAMVSTILAIGGNYFRVEVQREQLDEVVQDVIRNVKGWIGL